MPIIDEQTAISELLEICERLHLNDIRVAGATGISCSTIFNVRVARRLPKRETPRRSLLNFIAVNRGARSLSDLRFVSAA